jgi:hypothetical protein
VTYFDLESDGYRVNNFEENVGNKHADGAIQTVVNEVPHTAVTSLRQHLQVNRQSNVKKVSKK